MTESIERAKPASRLPRVALFLSAGGLLLAIVGAVGSGAGGFSFKIGLLLLVAGFLVTVVGGVLALIAIFMGRVGRRPIGWTPLAALAIAGIFGGYFAMQVVTAAHVPPIHDVSTDLDNVPHFTAIAERADNFADIPAGGDATLAALSPEERWKAIHRKAYGDIRTLEFPIPPAAVMARAEALVRARGWAVAKIDAKIDAKIHKAGPGREKADGAPSTIEATATSLFFRFKDDVIIRVRPDPRHAGWSLVDMRSVSRVGQSDVGVNARRIRAALADLGQGLATKPL